MSSVPGWVFALMVSLLCTAGGLVVLLLAGRQAKVEARIRQVQLQSDLQPRAQASGERSAVVPMLRAIGRAVMASGFLSRKTIADLEQTIAASGHRAGPAVSLFIGVKVTLIIGLPLLALFLLRVTEARIPPVLVMAPAGIIGLMLPDFVMRNIRKRYLAAVETGLPVVLDLLIICAEAGLALEAGFERVAEEAKEGASAAANELRITANEMKILSDRRQALVNMGTRTGLESLTRLGGTLAQSMKYGTPLTQALRVLAAEMRHTMLMRFEARAARIPVLLTLPMIAFILPCIFVVVAGPAAVKVMQMRSSQ
jgi:tight adherence protein C